MKTKLILIMAVFAGKLLADTFTGEILGTFTVLNGAPNAQVGDSFTGFYSYESDTMDGTFDRTSLTGSLDLPSWFIRNPIDLSRWFPHLTVTDGTVDFVLYGDYGPLSFNFYEDHFNFSLDDSAQNSEQRITGAGTMQFGSPVGQTLRVTDAGVTAMLLLGTFLVLIFFPIPTPLQNERAM